LGFNGSDEQTPNFAMNTTDVDPTAPPAEKRCTTHLFQSPTQHVLTPGITVLSILKPGFPLQLYNTPEDPPAILFNGIYAGAILHHYGTQALKDALAKTWRDMFYPGGVMDVAHFDEQAPPVDSLRTEISMQQNTAHDEAEASSGHGLDMSDMLMVLPYVMVPPNELQAALRGAREVREAAELRHVQEKVDQWNRQVENA
jgi:hypothetical protein